MTGADHTPSDALAATFLGRAAGAGGPFALLGLGHDQTDAGAIRAAVARRIAQVDRHPLRLTPEADEMRLAIHAAGAQLGDPALHAELVRHWPPGEPDQMPAAWRSHTPAVPARLAVQARRIVGASGGWNARAKRRLAHVARVHRVAAVDLIRALRPDTSALARVRPTRRAAPRIEPIAAPASTGRTWMMIHGALVSMLVVMLTLSVVELFGPAAGEPGDDATEPGRTMSDPAARAEAPLVPGPRAEINHHAALSQELSNILLMAADRPAEGAVRGVRSVRTFLDRWVEMPSDARDRIASQIVRVVGAVSVSPQSGAVMLEPLAEAARDADPARAAAARVLGAQVRDAADLPASIRRAAEAIAEPAVSGAEGFDAAAVSALTERADRPTNDDATFWESWSSALAACDGASTRSRTQARLSALDALVRDPSPPGPTWRRTAAELAGGLSWRSGEPARRWLIGLLDDPDVAPSRLSGLTEAVASDISAPGVNPSMVLPPDADAGTRRALASAYRRSWLAPATGDASIRAEVLARLAAAVDAAERPGGSDPVERLVSLARANAAAASLFAGDEPLSAELLAATDPEPSGPSAPHASSGGGASLDDAWGAELFRTEDATQVRAMLEQASRQRPAYSALAAEALLARALQGEPANRDLARGMVVASAGDPQILIALERAANRRPSSAVGGLISAATGVTLPAVRDPTWIDRVRAAVLPLIAERLADTGSDRLVFAELTLAELGAQRAGFSAGTPPLKAVLAEAQTWAARNDLPDSDPLSTFAIEARRRARLDAAAAPSQHAAVHHRALVEAIAGAAVSQAARPRTAVDRLLNELAANWSESRTVVGQFIASQRAEAALWQSLLEDSL